MQILNKYMLILGKRRSSDQAESNQESSFLPEVPMRAWCPTKPQFLRNEGALLLQRTVLLVGLLM
jgi:hypothetical protein